MTTVKRATLAESKKEKGKTSRLLVRFGEGEEIAVDHYEPWGFAAFPTEGSEVVLMSEQANADFCFGLMVHDRRGKKPLLAAGESAVYADDETFVKTGPKGIEIESAKDFRAKIKGDLDFSTGAGNFTLKSGAGGTSMESAKAFSLKAKGLKLEANGTELIETLLELIDALQNSSKAGNVQVVNPNLPAIKAKLQKLKP